MSEETSSLKRKITSEPNGTSRTPTQTTTTTACPYLDTIDRSVLDFDFEPSCSVSLQSGPHIYGCLVCGKFFRGRGLHTPAYTHSVDEGHFVFVHLSKGTFHCLPDDYLIQDPSLADISAALHPSFTRQEIAALDSNVDLARDLFGRRYLPGFVGLNNLNRTDGMNAVVQALAHVRPLRDFFLKYDYTNNLQKSSSKKARLSNNNNHHPKTNMSLKVTQAFAQLIRKIWSSKRFKSHVDPHMFIQAVLVASNNKFRIGHQCEAGEFLAWLLHQLHLGLGGTRKPGSSIIHQIFQGQVQVAIHQAKVLAEKGDKDEDDDRGGSDEEAETKQTQPTDEKMTVEKTISETHFLQLTLDVSEKPLFRDDDGGLVIPQEPLVTVLKKFDGITMSDAVSRSGTPQRRQYRIRKLPNYLILHLARFKTNRYSREKNPTIVPFPIRNLDLSEYVFPNDTNEKPKVPKSTKGVSSKLFVSLLCVAQVKELKEVLSKHGRSDLYRGVVDKAELVQIVIDFCITTLPDLLSDKYDLVANITHDSPADVGREGQHDPLQEGSYKCHVQHQGGSNKQWYEMQDLHVEQTMAQLIGLSQSYLLIFERKCARQPQHR